METKMMLWLVVVSCLWWNSMSMRCPTQFQPLLRSVVNETADAYKVGDPVQISGPNGHCVAVRDGGYHNGNAIILWTCQSDPGVDQLWTFESDGTVRSNGKCLTTYGYTQGSYIMIYDCDSAVRDSTIWETRDNGEIVNPTSGLVLTVMSGQPGTTLTAQKNTFSSFQTWRVDGDITPNLVSIVGFRGLCLQGSDSAVWVSGCDGSNEEQRWLMYPDGTIRPEQKPEWCLSYDNLINARVVVLSCGLTPSGERWLFKQSGEILNERANLVMDVRQSNPDLKEIIVYPATGNQNQKWVKKPL